MAKLNELKQEVTADTFKVWRSNYKIGDKVPPEMEKYALATALKLSAESDIRIEALFTEIRNAGYDV
jgi:hypothetical protein